MNESDPKPWLIIAGALAIFLASFFFSSCPPDWS
jgi:hypothetical protein